MRSVFRRACARAALLSASLIAVPAGSVAPAVASPGHDARPQTVSAAAGLRPGCAWDLTVASIPPGYNDFYATGARNRYLVGAGTGPAGLRALLWDTTRDTATVLDAPSHDQAIAMDVNNHGVVVANDIDTRRPYLWDRGRTVTLARPRGATSASATAINDAGTVVGSAVIDDREHGIVWSTHSPRKYQDLGTGDGWLDLNDVSESGTIVAGTRSGEFGITVALKGTATGGLSRIQGLDRADDSNAHAVAGAYVVGSGSWPGATDPSSIRWHGDTAVTMPSEFRGFDVNSTGLVGGATEALLGGVTTGQAAVWDGDTVTTLPNHRSEGFSSVGAVTENGTVFGLSQATDDSMEGGLPVTWTCS